MAIDLYCGLGGWTEGFLAEGFDVVGFDIEQHVYGEHRYPAQLVIQDVCTLHGSQFRDAAIIVASSPCQEFSYRAMPWKRAKALGPPEFGMHLFAQAARIQREASEAAGQYIPMVQENVKGAQPWVGRARRHYGSYYLWGDVPGPVTEFEIILRRASRDEVKRPGHDWNRFNETGEVSPHWRMDGQSEATKGPLHGWSNGQWQSDATKNTGGSWFAVAHNTTSGHRRNPDGRLLANNGRDALVDDGRKQGGDWFRQPGISAHASRSSARRAASARIAKIPLALARYVARSHYPGSLALGPGREG